MTSWYDFYKERMNNRYLSRIKTKYEPFINRILDSHAYHFLELGCGAGFITRALREKSRYRNFTLVDSCPKMLGLAMENNPSDKCLFLCADIMKHHTIPNCDEYTVVHSHGVLEHFSDTGIEYTMSMAENYSPFQVHFVPGAKYEKPSRGDERLMTVDQWSKIVKNIDRIENFDISTFNDGYDILITTWKNGSLK